MGHSRDRFVRLAEARTSRLLKDIALLSNLSNRTNYSYTEEDVKKIFTVIYNELKGAQVKFETNLKSSGRNEFKL